MEEKYNFQMEVLKKPAVALCNRITRDDTGSLRNYFFIKRGIRVLHFVEEKASFQHCPSGNSTAGLTLQSHLVEENVKMGRDFFSPDYCNERIYTVFTKESFIDFFKKMALARIPLKDRAVLVVELAINIDPTYFCIFMGEPVQCTTNAWEALIIACKNLMRKVCGEFDENYPEKCILVKKSGLWQRYHSRLRLKEKEHD